MQLWDSDVPSLRCQCVRYFAIEHHRYFAVKSLLPQALLKKIQDLRVEIGIYIRIHRKVCEILPEQIIVADNLTIDWQKTAECCYSRIEDKNAFAFAVVNALIKVTVLWIFFFFEGLYITIRGLHSSLFIFNRKSILYRCIFFYELLVLLWVFKTVVFFVYQSANYLHNNFENAVHVFSRRFRWHGIV